MADPYLFAFTNNHEVVSLVTNVGTFTTAGNQILAGSNNSGWWSSTDTNSDFNDNYIAGDYLGQDYRDFFTFFIPEDLGTVTSAYISAPRGSGGVTTGGIPLTYSLFDVSTNTMTLNATGGPNAAIFSDLGSGTLYGSVLVTDVDLPDPLEITLNADLLAALNVARDGGAYFSVGGVVTPSQVPEPASLLLFGSALLAIGPIRKFVQKR